MVTIRDYIDKCDFVINTLLDEQEKVIYKNENEIIQLNTNQFDNGQGSDDKPLKHNSDLFKGVYSLSTQLANPKKVAGSLYNFYDSGDFLSGLQIEIDGSLTRFSIFSTGTGSGDKKLFFDNYRNLFGLNAENTLKLNYEILQPELMNYIKRYL